MTEFPETGFVLSVSTATWLAGPKLHKNTRVLVQCSDPCGKEVSLCAFEIDGGIEWGTARRYYIKFQAR